MLKVRMTGGQITDDLYILIGRIKKTHGQKRICYYLGNDDIPYYNVSDEGFEIGDWIDITDVENIFLGGMTSIGEFDEYIINGTDPEGDDIPVHEGKKMFFSGGEKGNKYSNKFFITIARCTIIDGTQEGTKLLTINEIGDTIPVTLKLGLSKDSNDDLYIQYVGNIGSVHENVSYISQ